MKSILSSRLSLSCYHLLMNLAVPALGVLLLPFLLFIRKRRKTLLPRLGLQRYPRPRDATPKPLWVHALSVGELLSCVPLIRELHRRLPSRRLYLSVSTLAARELADEKLADDVDGLFYFPYDLWLPVHLCLQMVRPALFVLVETDIWPGFFAQLRGHRIPCILVNGRLSPASFRFSRALSVLFLPAFATFARIYPQSEEEADRFLALGIKPKTLFPAGNLKYDVVDPPPSSETLASRRRSLGLEPEDRVLLAGSTHPGEEALLRKVFIALRRDFPELKLILVPRHPSRAFEVEQLFAHDQLRVFALSRTTAATADVIVVDRLGMLSGLYALADVTFVGGSLVDKGGQNPIEPAAAGKPVLFGPDMSDFPEVSRLLLEGGGAIQVRNRPDLLDQCRQLLADPARAVAVGIRARTVVDQHRGTTRRLAGDVATFLQTLEGRPKTFSSHEEHEELLPSL